MWDGRARRGAKGAAACAETAGVDTLVPGC
jgi:hypothetical protein